ncbi:MAG: ABC transporter ATP-binding protein [Acidobacteria bacterium]|nr:ABC transporter ATP-binding protein [Acidobacteriota bacterium]
MTYRLGKVEVHALRDVNFQVYEGEFVAVMGPSGCGKSTLLHLLGGLMRPTEGAILIDGVDIARLSDGERTTVRRNKVGFIFQRFNLLPTLTAQGNIELAKKIHGNGFMSEYGFDEITAMLGIRDRLEFRPPELSGGEQQRVAIARALINQPSIILADEPTGSLDSRNSLQVLRLMRDLNENLQQTIIMITHDPEAASMARRIVHMRDGQMYERPQMVFEPEFEGIV